MDDKMPKWMLMDHTDEELEVLYNNLPFVNCDMTFKEFKNEWEYQRKENINE